MLKHFRTHDKQQGKEDIFKEGRGSLSLRPYHAICSLFHLLINANCSMIKMVLNLESEDVNLNPSSVTHSFLSWSKTVMNY